MGAALPQNLPLAKKALQPSITAAVASDAAIELRASIPARLMRAPASIATTVALRHKPVKQIRFGSWAR